MREVSSFKTLLYKFEVLGDVDTELVMPVSIDDEGLLTLPVGSSIQDYYTKQERESLVVDDLAVRRRLVSYGIPYGLHDSALYFSLRSSLLNRMNRFVSEKPVRRFIFGGPLIMTNHYRVD